MRKDLESSGVTGREMSSPEDDRLSPSSEVGNRCFVLLLPPAEEAPDLLLPLPAIRIARISSSSKKTCSASFIELGVTGRVEEEARPAEESCGVAMGLGEKSQLSIVGSLIGF